MKKQILNIGKALNKAEQRLINGGDRRGCKLLGLDGEVAGFGYLDSCGDCIRHNEPYFPSC